MLRTFSELRGVSMKVGQMLSYLGDVLPPEAQQLLVALQRDATPISYEAVRAVIAEELGSDPEELFASFDPTPLAAASVGQVHRAVLRDGTPVAVKVQYPGVEDAMRADIQNLRFGSTLNQVLFVNTDVKATMDELEERFLDECDYRKEADYQEEFAKRFEGHPTIVVSKVHRELSSRRVLVTTFYDGKTLYQWLEAKPSAPERERVASAMLRFYVGSLYIEGLFNCDPHPGNYLFLQDGRVVFPRLWVRTPILERAPAPLGRPLRGDDRR